MRYAVPACFQRDVRLALAGATAGSPGKGKLVIRLGLLSFSDGRNRVHTLLAPDIQAHANRIRRALEGTGEVTVELGSAMVDSAASARNQAERLADMRLDGLILNIPVFAFPSYPVIAAQVAPIPCLLVSPQDPRYPGLGGLLGAAGGLTQIGRVHERIWLDLDDSGALANVLAWARAAAAATRSHGRVYGLIGGRSIGMYTGAAPAELWQRLFGIDVEHVDQSEIIRRAEVVPSDDVHAAQEWLERHVAEVVYDGQQLTPQKLEFEVRCWLALQAIVEEFGFDLAGLKCHFDMSEFHSVQCLGAAFLNDPYDWRGPKRPVPLACEADSDGALTMLLLSLVSGKPSCLLDVRYFDRERGVYVMPNCGAAPTWFAARSDDPAANLSRVRIVPSITKYAGGGAHTEFVFGAGDVTLARLSRSPAGYRMLIGHGETVDLCIGQVEGSSPRWPHAFVRAAFTPDELVQAMEANHLHVVAGDYRLELQKLCRMLGVESIVLGEPAAG